MDLKEFAKDYFESFSFNVIPLENKAPTFEWKKYQIEEMESSDIDNCNWNLKTNGIGAICGINSLRCLDFDKISNFQFVQKIAEALGLGENYEWIVKSGSGNGYHIWFKCDDPGGFLDGLGYEKAYYIFNLKEKGICDHIELRWKNCQTVLPPSNHQSGNIYEFVNHVEVGLPENEPKNVWIGKLLEVVKEYCVIEDVKGQRSKVKSKDVETLRSGDGKRKKKDVETLRSENVKTLKGKDVKTERAKRKGFNYDFNEDELNEVITIIKSKINNYEEYMRIGFALASLGEIGRKYFIDIAVDNPKYPNDTEVTLNKKFDGFLRDYDERKSTLGTLFHIAAKYGWKSKKAAKVKNTDWLQLAKDYLGYYYDFKFNELTQKLMWSMKGEHDFNEFTDFNLSSVYIELKSSERIIISYEDLRRLLNSDFVERFNPLNEYFENLDQWDGKDYIKELSKTIICESDDIDFWKISLRKWLIACVAGVLNPREVNQTAIILQGSQGIGKTRWIKRLLPISLKDYLFTGNISPNDKDSKLAVVKNFIIDLDELETLNRDEIGFLKSLMTQKEIQLRKPYGHYEEKYIRQSSFIGSVNRKDFLNDMTGSRRFLSFEVLEINSDHDTNMDNVFAQALHLYKKGFEYWFDKFDSDEITRRNEKFTFRTMEEEKILDRYEPAEKDDENAQFLTTTEIAEKLFDERKINNGTMKQIGMVLNKYNFKKISKRVGNTTQKKWVVREVTNGMNTSHFPV